MATKFTIRHDFDRKKFAVDYAKELNKEQLKVVTDGEGPVLVLAGAGSGKTRTIVYRVSYLLEQGVDPEHILLVTFTNKAAKEMMFRVERLLGQFPKGLWGGTFHHIANILLRKYAKVLGFQPNFTILDSEDSRDLIGVIIKDLDIDTTKTRFPSSAVVQDILSLAQNTEIGLEELIEERRPEFIKILGSLQAIQSEYAKRKQRNNQMDFDDLLVKLCQLLREHEGVRKTLAQQFRYVLVDEYQDTNKIQASIVRLLSEHHRNILVVGDDAQSIYSFRGADIGNILAFPNIFPDCRTFALTTNYRSTQPILDVANEVISKNRSQFQKTLVHVRTGAIRPAIVPAASPKQEAEFVAQMVLQLRDEGIPLNKMAVLFRAAHLSQSLEFELTKRDIPYEYRGGVRFFERAHIKDIISYLKVLDNPNDEVAWMRVLSLQVGIGTQTAGNIFSKLREAGGLPESLPLLSLKLPARAQTGWRRVQSVFATLLKHEYKADPSMLITTILASDYRDYLMNEYPNFQDRIDDLEQLALFAKPYTELSKFLAEVSLQEAFAVQNSEEDGAPEEVMVLSTIHQAKGLEWEVVFLIHLVEPGFPNVKALAEPRGVEEERRLFYVAITRAMTHLFISYPVASDYQTMSMRMFDTSRFVRELNDSLLEQYELQDEFRALGWRDSGGADSSDGYSEEEIQVERD